MKYLLNLPLKEPEELETFPKMHGIAYISVYDAVDGTSCD